MSDLYGSRSTSVVDEINPLSLIAIPSTMIIISIILAINIYSLSVLKKTKDPDDINFFVFGQKATLGIISFILFFIGSVSVIAGSYRLL